MYIQSQIKLEQTHEGIREENLDFHHLLGPVGDITGQHLSTKKESLTAGVKVTERRQNNNKGMKVKE